MNKNDMEINDIIAEAMSKRDKAASGGEQQEASAASSAATDSTATKQIDRSDMVFNYGDDDRSREDRGSGSHRSSKNGGSEKSGKNGKNGKGKKKGSAKKAVLITLLVILLILIIAVIVVYAYVMSKINKIHMVDREYDNSIVESIEENPPEIENPNNEPDSPDSDIEALESQIEEVIINQQDTIPIKFSDDVYNILLIGSDARSTNERGRSDSMIIISINKKTEQIVMTSIMRDIYLSIPGKSNNRINAAYSWGGSDLLIQTIENTFKIRIDKYVKVDFTSFEKVIDAVGGVDIPINDAEMKTMASVLGSQAHGADTYHLNGAQALTYARIRKIGNADFERTQRQRRVLQEIIKSAKALSISEMNDWLDTILPLLTTDLEKGEILDLILHSASYLNYERVELRIPYDGSWWNMRINGMAVLGIDFEANRQKMVQTIYGE